jgi:hypothetical protein
MAKYPCPNILEAIAVFPFYHRWRNRSTPMWRNLFSDTHSSGLYKDSIASYLSVEFLFWACYSLNEKRGLFFSFPASLFSLIKCTLGSIEQPH